MIKTMLNKGLHQYRFRDNPLEERFARAWERMNKFDSLHTTLEYILAKNNNNPEHVSERDRVVAATVIQWLGSPVGQQFIRDVMKKEAP